ncbi:MAG: ATP-binding protein [Nannocystaceae bacterium]
MDQPQGGAGVLIDDSLARMAGLSVVVVERAPGLPILRGAGAPLVEPRADMSVRTRSLCEHVFAADAGELEARLLGEGEAASVDVRLAADPRRWIRVHATPGPGMGALSLLIQEVTAERAAALRATMGRAWTRAIAGRAPLVLCGVDGDGVLTHFERYAEDGACGLVPEVVGRPIAEVFDGLPGHLAAFSRALNGERISQRVQQGAEILEFQCEAVDVDDGLGTRVLGAILDVTRQAELDAALAENRGQLEMVVHTVADGILLNDAAGRIKFVNTRLASLLGVRPEAMLGRHIFEFMDEESAGEARANLERRRAGNFDRFDHRWRRADGSALWSVVAAKPMLAADGTHLGSLVTVTDITERKLAEDALKEARDELERRVQERTAALEAANRRLRAEVETRTRATEEALRASRVKSAFLASMSHELRTPLNAIIGYNEIIIEDMAETGSGAEHLRDLGRVLDSSRHLLSLIDDILDLAKIEAAKVEVELSTFRLGDVLHRLEATILPLALKGNNVARFECAAIDADAAITTDRTKLKQVLLNLLGNACKFTRDGEIVLRAAIAPRGDLDWLEITVVDTGVGIAPADQERIFEAFAQSDLGREVKFGGTGLGLTISKRLCEMLGGEIGVRSVVGEGTTFAVALPLRRREAAAG